MVDAFTLREIVPKQKEVVGGGGAEGDWKGSEMGAEVDLKGDLKWTGGDLKGGGPEGRSEMGAGGTGGGRDLFMRCQSVPNDSAQCGESSLLLRDE